VSKIDKKKEDKEYHHAMNSNDSHSSVQEV